MSDVWRLIDDLDSAIPAADQMAADVALLEAATRGGGPVLRLYRWTTPCLSLGRFQPDADVDYTACRRLGASVVRRPTGGRGLLHGGDLTYAVAMARPPGDAGQVGAVYNMLASGLIAGLAIVGVRAAVAHRHGPSGAVCFASQQGADLRVGERKLCGSAQVHRGDALLQHGSVLLERLPFDETDLLQPAAGECAGDGGSRREHLRAVTVTLGELGATTDAAVVGRALVEGFSAALDVEFR